MITDTFTPYSTVTPFIAADGYPEWASDEDKERIGSYLKYDEMYWSDPRAFKVVKRGDDAQPIYVPNARKIVDTTSHYYLKGVEVKPESGDPQSPFGKWLSALLKREQFYSRFHMAKHSGVARGDYLYHITADPAKPATRRLSMTSVDPASYYVEHDPDDLDKRLSVRLVDQWLDPKDHTCTKVKILKYWYVTVDGSRRVARHEAIWKMWGWDHPERSVKLRDTIKPSLLPKPIEVIPLYHFKNLDWQGQDFGSSEIRGFERLAQGVNQVVSDLELALALDGLGVYATDAGRPINEETGEEEDWEVAPGRVLEVPGATMFKRVEGVSSSKPALDFVNYLQDSLYEASSTSKVAMGSVDVQVAESGIALSIQFIPTMAKLEQRDLAGVATLENLWFDLMFWNLAYEGVDYRDQEIQIKLGDKLPVNRPKKIEELNNMRDRDVISRKYYRTEMEKLGYVFPKTIEQEILDEAEKFRVAKTPPEVPGAGGRLEGSGDTLPQGSKSNNTSKPNESAGTEVGR